MDSSGGTAIAALRVPTDRAAGARDRPGAGNLYGMPELPEVETIARDLRGLVEGARIVSAECDWANTIRGGSMEAFATGVAGRRIEGVGRRGKQLLLCLGPKDSSGAGVGGAGQPAAADGESGKLRVGAFEPAVMTVHLKMTGQLFVVAPSVPRDGHVRLVLGLEDGRELRFRDIRKFGRVGLYPRDPVTGEPVEGSADGVLARGPEPLAEEFTARRFGELLAKRRGRLKSLLLNQDFVAGVGNIYADEALWRARLHPLRDAATLRPRDARRLYQAVRHVLSEAVERRGSSVDDYTAPEGDGSMQEHLAVYQRAGEACLRCGRPIRRIVVGGRATHFCSWCQRMPRGLGRPAATETGAATATGAASGRRGPRWTELDGKHVLGRTRAEEAAAEARQRRAEATRRAAATRRQLARGGGGPSTGAVSTARGGD
jgi:formamidopyrimidine-DNA glycosylase